MRINALAATATIVVLAFGASACKSSSKASGGATAAANPPATQTQADSPSAETSASTSPSAATSAAAATSASTSPSAAASTAPAAAAGGAINVCSLLSGTQAAALTKRAFGAGTESTLAPGQDQCEYPYPDGVAMDVIVYEPDSGVTFAMSQAVLSGEGTVMSVPGVGDKASFAGIDLDVATGKYVIDISAAGGLGDDTGAIAIAKVLVPELASK
jgi:hypothetical protein